MSTGGATPLVLASIGVWAMALDRALRFRRLAQDARALRPHLEHAESGKLHLLTLFQGLSHQLQGPLD